MPGVMSIPLRQRDPNSVEEDERPAQRMRLSNEAGVSQRDRRSGGQVRQIDVGRASNGQGNLQVNTVQGGE